MSKCVQTIDPTAAGDSRLIDLITPEGAALADIPHNYYPRPQLERDSFLCLNGKWEFETNTSDTLPDSYSLQIVVPFAPQSLLSGVHKAVPDEEYLFYRRTFTLPEGFAKDRVILHFGAVDQVADVWVNGTWAGSHTGGYEPFSFVFLRSLDR